MSSDTADPATETLTSGSSPRADLRKRRAGPAGRRSADRSAPQFEDIDVTRRPSAQRSVVRRSVGQFLLVGFVALVVLTVASLIASRRAGTDEAIRDAKERTAVLADQVLEPRLTPDLIAGDQAEVDALAEAMSELRETESFIHLRVWAADGRIIYSDQPGLTGTTVELGNHAQEAFDTGEVFAEVSDLTAEENVLERGEGKLLEVYQPVIAADGTRLLFETYHPFDAVSDSARQIWWQFLPALLIPLLLLELVHVPLAVRLARRVQRAQDEREQLMLEVLNASDNERKQIAHDLHDGAVQDLSGVSYALSVVSERATRSGDERSAGLLKSAQADIRRSIQSLRSLFVEIYPPNLQRAGLEVALSDLLAALQGRGIEPSFAYPDGLELSAESNKILYRIAQETTRNVVRHAKATRLSVEIQASSDAVSMSLIDDGEGFDVDEALDAGGGGHLGLRIMADLIAEAGGTLDIASTADGDKGTELRVELPR